MEGVFIYRFETPHRKQRTGIRSEIGIEKLLPGVEFG
jgi:hypothetical protein